MAKSDLIKILHSYFQFGFHLSRQAWEWLDLRETLSAPGAAEGSSEIYTLRLLSDRFNTQRSQTARPTQSIQAGQLFSVGVIIDVLRYLVRIYCYQEFPGVMSGGLDWTMRQKGAPAVDHPPPKFVGLFPPISVIRGQQSESEYLQDASDIIPPNQTAVSEMMLLHVAMSNPAFRPYLGLFDDIDLRTNTPYLPLIDGLEQHFSRQPVFRPIGLTLFECLRAPIRACPDSLDGQLDFMRLNWASFLPPELLERILLATDILKEEEKMRGFGAGPNVVLEFGKDLYGDLGYPEPAGFSRDADWMSNVVLIAKSVYVWLDQLSRHYQRHLHLLSDIPDEELDRLARWGFTGLWLIGLWERSPASQKIKQIMGNPEAAASAYSLYDYIIAADLGGEEAYQNLRARAWRRGIRLSSDMVPNHMGIYSRWVIEHPDWFIQRNSPPFPSYNYNGIDLSLDPRVVIQIEDGYWERRDAAVVFKRIDKWTGDVRYIYHGNDGTNMPWNDTAQLNFMLPEVREAVVQTILHVARKFPIIRFDAAMTLAKKHYQRLWFPQPGEGGAIPSRAEYGMNKKTFEEAFPKEFWREVVDRVTRELPDTLLLAEAFWLMEGYFVRTLGMHRVYNSAFMNMLKMEDNCKYRMTVKNVLEFSPEVLKRFVNFMNNPDELTALEQFGKGDKYFGVAMLMVTMPGLPMFGHGQIEGFAEKYGMEYRKAYWNEQVDEEMVRRHEAQIFPLMQRRRLFSGAENFAFYDFNSPEGWVDENVFAYSNRSGSERAIILYNNAYNTTRGWIHISTAINVAGPDEDKRLVRKNLAEALALNTGDGYFYSFRDHQTDMEYIRKGRQLADEGLFATLQGYQYHAFLDFREIFDLDGSWVEIWRRLAGNGVPNLVEACTEVRLEPVLVPYRQLMSKEMLQIAMTGGVAARKRFRETLSQFLDAAHSFTGAEINLEDIQRDIDLELEPLFPAKKTRKNQTSGKSSTKILSRTVGQNAPAYLHLALAWITIRHLGQLRSSHEIAKARLLSNARLHEWLLRKIIKQAFFDFSGHEGFAYLDALLVVILIAHEDALLYSEQKDLAAAWKIILEDAYAQEYLLLNQYGGVHWINKERLERAVEALLFITALQHPSEKKLSLAENAARRILEAAGRASYQIEKILELLEERDTVAATSARKSGTGRRRK